MSPDDINAMIASLRNATAFGRLSQCEVEAAFEKLAELGYVIAKPAPVNG